MADDFKSTNYKIDCLSLRLLKYQPTVTFLLRYFEHSIQLAVCGNKSNMIAYCFLTVIYQSKALLLSDKSVKRKLSIVFYVIRRNLIPFKTEFPSFTQKYIGLLYKMCYNTKRVIYRAITSFKTMRRDKFSRMD